MITIDHSESHPYAYYGDDEGATSANNPAFWYAIGLTKPNYPVPAIPIACAILPNLVQIAEVIWYEGCTCMQDADFELVAEYEPN